MPIVDGKNQDLENELAETTGQGTQEGDLPEKYRGKSVADIVRMHQEAERLIGRQSSEVSELRKLADDHIRANLESLKSRNETAEEPDFFADPKQAVRKIVESDPEIVALREKTKYLEMQSNREALAKAHPDFMDVVQSPDFQEWVMASKYRTNLLKQADATWDYEAADELFGTWKDLNSAKTAKKAAEVRSEARKTASVPSGGGGGGDVSPDSRKIYRRADIIRLQQTDPKRYTQMADEIMEAYRTGRVR